ncbi:nucleotidyl transferase AbiEii/AbiGii toxin family protein [Micromonospora haikouensis]|uniref:nucleotidyl transferase AbiEii/AbiGii toxin family protein n=1 Tax=Micromonospora haikouensis TaxID=686309 RepID=UPI003408934E
MTEPLSGHIGADFRTAFPTWADLRHHVAACADILEFDTARGLQHLLKADVASRFHEVPGVDWMLYGSTGLPARVPPGTRTSLGPSASGVDAAYVMTRSAFDVDLALVGDEGRDGDRHHLTERLAAALQTVAAPEAEPGTAAGIGLGGLVRYSISAMRIVPDNGKVYGQITAQPINPRYGVLRPPAVDNPLTIEVDLSPYKAVTQPPEVAQRPVLGLQVPGFQPLTPLLTPNADAMADKICNLAGVPRSSRNADRPPDFHRYKDLFDIYYMIETCPFSAGELRRATEQNHNMPRIGLQRLPVPYQLFREPGAGTLTPLPWAREYEVLRQGSLQLRHYPPFAQMRERVGSFADALAAAPDDAVWNPSRGWQTLPQQRRSAALLAFQPLTERPGERAAGSGTGSQPPPSQRVRPEQRRDQSPPQR